MLHFPCKRLIAHLLLLGQFITSCSQPTYLYMQVNQDAVPRSVASPPSTLCKVYHAAPRPLPLPHGAILHFQQKGSSCWATLTSSCGAQFRCFPGFSRSYATDVRFAPGYYLADLIYKKAFSSLPSRHIHLFSKDQTKPLVYIGPAGLKGGSVLNWLGFKGCTTMFCTTNVWRCICGYKCSDDSCWKHCTKHRSGYKCAGCHSKERCPKYYTCHICSSTTHCSNCCRCHERERLPQEKNASERQVRLRKDLVVQQLRKQLEAEHLSTQRAYEAELKRQQEASVPLRRQWEETMRLKRQLEEKVERARVQEEQQALLDKLSTLPSACSEKGRSAVRS